MLLRYLACLRSTGKAVFYDLLNDPEIFSIYQLVADFAFKYLIDSVL